jgi:hypothetical protein
MSGGPIETALVRIEAALDRIEGAAVALPADDGALRERHERLRQAVGQSLRQLDTLLAGQKG